MAPGAAEHPFISVLTIQSSSSFMSWLFLSLVHFPIWRSLLLLNCRDSAYCDTDHLSQCFFSQPMCFFVYGILCKAHILHKLANALVLCLGSCLFAIYLSIFVYIVYSIYMMYIYIIMYIYIYIHF